MRAVAYIRVSKEKEEGYSPSTQLQKIRDYCRMRDMHLIDVFRDLDLSGRKEDRPDFQRLIERVKQGDIDYVIVYRVDRFSRSTRDFLYYLDILEQHGCNLASVNESFDASTPFGRAMVSMLAVFAQLESDSIGERIRDNLAQAVKQKKIHLGARPPYGYARNKGRLTVIPVQAEHVRWMYERYLAGEGTRTLASQLTQAHVPTPTGRRVWRYTTVQAILENPVYAGFIEWNGEVVEGEHEAIVLPTYWGEVQRTIKARAGGPRSTGEASVLGRLLRCEICGRPGNIKHGHRRDQQRYICTVRSQSSKAVCGNIAVDALSLERRIVEVLLSGINTADLRLHVQRAKRELLTDQTRLDETDALAKRRDTLRAAIDRLFADHYEHDIITRDQFVAANERYLAELREVESKMEELGGSVQAAATREADIDLFARQVDALSAWGEMTTTERRTVLAQLVKHISWAPGEAIMYLQFGEEVPLSYFEVRRGVAFFDNEHWPKCSTCGEKFRTPAGLASHQRRWGH